jgi:hypothetical protein
MHSLKSAALILLLSFLASWSAPAASGSQSSQAVDTTSHVRLICTTVNSPNDPPPPHATCDDLCAAQNAVCVWNSDNVNPHSCETPTYGVCRCCHLSE